MNKGDKLEGLFPKRADIAIKHPKLYDLLTRHLPTEQRDYCQEFEG